MEDKREKSQREREREMQMQVAPLRLWIGTPVP
jgi:hypothetical protein